MANPKRIFISHTSEFYKFPDNYSFVKAAISAVNRAGHVPCDMQYFTARDAQPSEYCKKRVRECDVYVGLIGFRYGSPVRDCLELSYTELEFEAASEEPAIPRLVFLLDDDSSVPHNLCTDIQHSDRQRLFRQRLTECGITCSFFSDAHELEKLIYQAMAELNDQEFDKGFSIKGFPAELLVTLIKDCPDGLCSKRYELPTLVEMFPSQSQEDIQEASYDLKNYGFLNVRPEINGFTVRLQPEAYEKVDPQFMGWNPMEDAVVLARLMINTGEASASDLQEKLGWPKRRFNPAQRIIVDCMPDGCVSKQIQPNYVASWVTVTPESRACLRRFVQGMSNE